MRFPRVGAAGNSGSIDLHVCGVLTNTAGTLARLDQVLSNNPLLPAIIYRSRLEAVRHMAAADGQLIDPWHLAAVLEGLRLRMPNDLRIIERGLIFDAARHALGFYQWLQTPDPLQEEAIECASAFLTSMGNAGGELITAARGIFQWIEEGGGRAAIWAALVRYWAEKKILINPLPITGAAALKPGVPWEFDGWLPTFLWEIGREAEQLLNMIWAMEWAWKTGRAAVHGKRKNSKLPFAVDLLAASPALSASSLANLIGVTIKSSTAMLDDLVTAGVAVEVTNRGKRRLFALHTMSPLRDVSASPRKPEPGRSRGRPRIYGADEALQIHEVGTPPVSPPPAPAIRFDYGDLDEALAALDAVVLKTKSFLDGFGTAVQRRDIPDYAD